MIDELRNLLDASHHTVVFTGAGISTLSGIPDFRSPQGVYNTPWHGRSVEEILSIDTFRAHPQWFYEWSRTFVYGLERFQPNVVHRVIAELEKRGSVQSVYTQNIDLLHRRAGSRRVFELHGSPAGHHCLECGRTFGYDQIAPRVNRGEVPYCPCGGLIKPDIVFYGEALDEELLDQAFDELNRTELLLVLGSSLTVQPAASMPLATRYAGGKIVIVNAQPTPLDREATLKFDDLKTVFEALERRLP